MMLVDKLVSRMEDTTCQIINDAWCTVLVVRKSKSEVER